MLVKLKILRFDPDNDKAPHFQNYEADVEPTDRVLDALNAVRWYQDGSLAYRSSCAHGICGSDAMRINRTNRLACKTLIRQVAPNITLEPIRGFPVKRDLIVDLTGFFEQYRNVMPYLVNEDPMPTVERFQSPEDRAKYDDTTKCILCASCTTSCPIFWANTDYIGPAAIVSAHRFIFDSRDQAGGERLDILNSREGAWRCRTIFNCTDACPRDIKVTKAIQDVKRAIMSQKL
ncbi:MAG: succinate dehydrogenase iron-sulfur subunit [Armatimonadota bacterium]|nr:succinate dehydrogenase iron-sulfur subunit [Armatimonadota bacterium]